jgi:hypothetical protein
LYVIIYIRTYFLTLAEAVELAIPKCLGNVTAITRTFADAGVEPFNPDLVLMRVPDVWPPPKAEKGRKPSLQDIAGYRQVSLTYDQTEYVKQAREKEREENAAKMKNVLTNLAEDPHCQPEFSAKLLELARNGLALFSNLQVCE